MKRRSKIAVGIISTVVVLMAVAIVMVNTFDWNRAKPWLSKKVSEATERSFAINGNLSLSWEPPIQKQSGWRRLIPWPHFRAQDIVLGNPAWASSGSTMARVQQVDFSLGLMALFHKTLLIPSLLLTTPNLILERDQGVRNNWTFPKHDQGRSNWQLDIQNLGITHGTVRYIDPAKNADVIAQLQTFNDGSIRWKLNGLFNQEKLNGEGQAGALMSLQSARTRYPVKATITVGKTTLIADGTLTDPAHLSALDVNLKIVGASMSELFPLSGIVLPTTPKFSTEGRVVGTVEPGNIELKYEKFEGKVGSSNIEGTLEYLQQKPRPLLRGVVTSSYLNFNDLGAVIGAGKHPEKQERKERQKVSPEKVLPHAPFKTDRWKAMDVQVDFSGEKIIHSEKLPLDDVHTKVRMDNGVLSLAPLTFGVAGGKLSADLTINGNHDPALATMKVTARNLKLNQLFPSVESMNASLGELVANAKLTGAGNSIATLLASSNGEVKALISDGTVSKFILEAIGLNIGSVVATKLFGDKQVPLNCMATDFEMADGVMNARTFIIDTTDETIRIDGNIDFVSEKLNLKVHPETKSLRLISLRSPLYIGGTFKHPDAGVDKKAVALKAGAAAALSTIAAPAAALLALINPGESKDSPCAKLLAQAKEKPTAPPPSKAVASAVKKR